MKPQNQRCSIVRTTWYGSASTTHSDQAALLYLRKLQPAFDSIEVCAFLNVVRDQCSVQPMQAAIMLGFTQTFFYSMNLLDLILQACFNTFKLELHLGLCWIGGIILCFRGLSVKFSEKPNVMIFTTTALCFFETEGFVMRSEQLS